MHREQSVSDTSSLVGLPTFSLLCNLSPAGVETSVSGFTMLSQDLEWCLTLGRHSVERMNETTFGSPGRDRARGTRIREMGVSSRHTREQWGRDSLYGRDDAIRMIWLIWLCWGHRSWSSSEWGQRVYQRPSPFWDAVIIRETTESCILKILPSHFHLVVPGNSMTSSRPFPILESRKVATDVTALHGRGCHWPFWATKVTRLTQTEEEIGHYSYAPEPRLHTRPYTGPFYFQKTSWKSGLLYGPKEKHNDYGTETKYYYFVLTVTIFL